MGLTLLGRVFGDVFFVFPVGGLLREPALSSLFILEKGRLVFMVRAFALQHVEVYVIRFRPS